MTDYTETIERMIPAPPDAIFDLLADPSRHREIDGSGEVRDAKTGAERLALGSQFGMAMNAGFSYSMVSTVIEFETDRRIAWQTRPPGFLAHLLGGRIWRYELEPVDGGTRVRETWDLSEEKGKAIVWRGRHAKAERSMTSTLERIEQIVTR